MREPQERRRAVLPAALVVLLLMVLASLTAACGGGDEGAGGGTTVLPTSTASPSPGSGAVLVVVPDNDFQQLEYSAVVDALKATGYTVVIANREGGDSFSGDVAVRADLAVADADAADYEAVVLIGGPGAAELFDDQDLQTLVRDAADADKVVAAICLSPVVLARAGLLEGRQGTVWEDETEELEAAGCTVVGAPVVTDGLIVTGSGPEAADEFAATVIEKLQSRQ